MDTRLYLPMTDEQLLECVCDDGDDLAFAEFHRRWYEPFRRSALSWLRAQRLPLDLADDVLQETFLDAAHVAEPIECASNWLLRLLWRQLMRARKRARRRLKTITLDVGGAYV